MSSSPVDLRVDWCSYEAAKYAVEHWHYSRIMPRGSQCHLGVWECNLFVGSVIVGRSISPNIGAAFGLTQHSCLEVTRIALKRHQSTVSHILMICIGLIKKQYPLVRLLVSFADSEQGHHGGIYQASNWVYVGDSIVNQYNVNGKWRNDTHVNRAINRSTFQQRKSPPKHKYLYPLDRAMRRQIEPLRQPYPKRQPCGPSVEGDTLPQAESQVRSLGAAS